MATFRALYEVEGLGWLVQHRFSFGVILGCFGYDEFVGKWSTCLILWSKTGGLAILSVPKVGSYVTSGFPMVFCSSFKTRNLRVARCKKQEAIVSS